MFISLVLQTYRNATFQLILASDSSRDRSYVMMIYDQLNLDADSNAEGLNIPYWLVMNLYCSGEALSTELNTLPSNTGWYCVINVGKKKKVCERRNFGMDF